MKNRSYALIALIISISIMFYLHSTHEKDIVTINHTIKLLPSNASSLSCATQNPTSAVSANAISYGAAGNDSMDDTNAIQAAIDKIGNTGGTLIIPPGEYLIDPSKSLHLRDNMTIRMDGVTIKPMASSLSAYSIMSLDNIENVTIIGGELHGEKITTQNTNIRIANLYINASRNIHVHYVKTTNSAGEGIAVVGDSNIISLCSITFDNNQQTGLYIASVNGLLLENSRISNTNGISSIAGIKFDPVMAGIIDNVTILHSQLIDNTGVGILANSSDPNKVSNISIIGNIISSNESNDGILLSNTTGNTILNNIIINNQNGVGLSENVSATSLVGNIISKNNGDGILISNSSNNTITTNIVSDNANGIISDNSTNIIADNIQSNNVVVPKKVSTIPKSAGGYVRNNRHQRN